VYATGQDVCWSCLPELIRAYALAACTARASLSLPATRGTIALNSPPAELLTLQVGEVPPEVSEFPGADDPAEDGKTTVSSRASCGWYTRRW
jgi:hypothetical protein